MEGFTVAPAGNCSSPNFFHLHAAAIACRITARAGRCVRHLQSLLRCRTFPRLMETQCQQPPHSRKPRAVTSIGFSPVLSPIQKSSPHKVAIRNSPSKTTKTPRNWRHCNQQVCPLMVTSAFKGVSHGCNQWPQRPSFVPNDNISRPLLGEQVELQAARCRLFGVYLIKVGMDEKLVGIFGGIKFHLPAILAFTRVPFGFDPYHTQVIICRLNNTPHASLELHKEG